MVSILTKNTEDDMTPDKMRKTLRKQTFNMCLKALNSHYPDQPAVELPAAFKLMSRRTGFTNGWHPRDGILHLKWMCIRGCELVDEGRIDEADRWVGFVQGSLWMSGFCSIDEMEE